MSSAGGTSPMRGYPRNRLTDRSGADPVVTKTARSRGFAISFQDAGAGPAIGALVKAGSVHQAREAGNVRLEGKDYVVQDGDVIHFKFNV